MLPNRFLLDAVSYDILDYEIVNQDLLATLPLNLADLPLDRAALMDAYFALGLFALGQSIFTDESAFLTAASGSKSGETRTIGPTVVGNELFTNGDFASNDLTGWGPGATFESTLTLSVVAGKIQAVSTQSGARFGKSLVLTVGKAYRFGARPAESWVVGKSSISWDAAFMSGARSDLIAPFTAGQLYLGYGAFEQSPMYLGPHILQGAAHTSNWDDFTAKEAVPLVGHNYLALSGIIEAITPPTASGNKVAFQADDAAIANGTPGERNRVRLVWDANKHLRLIVTYAGTEYVNLDFGVVDVSTLFEIAFSVTANEAKASLNGSALLRDTSLPMPAIAEYRIGRSNTGETWDGVVRRVRLYPSVMSDAAMTDPQLSFAIWGDSTAKGDGGTVQWHELLRTSYTPNRTVYNAGVSGQNTGSMKTGILADTAHRDWLNIFMDRPNTGETGETVISNYKASVANLQTDRYLFVPPVLNSPSGQPDTSATAIAYVQNALLNDPFFIGHTFDAEQQAAYIAEMNDDATRVGTAGDWTHVNNAGQALQAARIKVTVNALGW